MPPQWLRGASKTLKRSCRIKHSGSPNAHVGVRNLHLRQTRPGVSWQNASSLSSSTAVNATRIVPARYKELYEALQAVKKNAAAYVDLSRLDLALQGLENERFVTRIAGKMHYAVDSPDLTLSLGSARDQWHRCSATCREAFTGRCFERETRLGKPIGCCQHDYWVIAQVGPKLFH